MDERKRPEITEPVRILMEMEDETVSAKYLAPILHMNEGVIVKYAKDGTWNEDKLGKFIISGAEPGAHVKFFRMDFLQKLGFIEPKPPEKTERELLQEAVQLLGEILARMNGKEATV